MPRKITADAINRGVLYVDPTIKTWLKRRAEQRKQTMRVVADEILEAGIATVMKREKQGAFRDDPPV